MTHRFRCLRTTTAMSLVLLATCHDRAWAGKPLPTPPPVKYEIVVLGQNIGIGTINDQGIVVGDVGGRAKIFHIIDETAGPTTPLVEDLTDLIRASNPAWTVLDYATRINEAGQIAGRGFCTLADGTVAPRLYRYTPAAGNTTSAIVEVVSSFTGGTHYVQGLNNAGDVLIHRTTDQQNVYPETANSTDSAWLFTGNPGQGTPFEVLTAAVPRGVNDAGQITGQVNTGTTCAAFIWEPLQPLRVFDRTIAGTTTNIYNVSDGWAINNWGDIGGWARVGKISRKENTSWQAVIRQAEATSWNDLGISYSGTGLVRAINDNGVPVGDSGGLSGLGFVYLNGKAYSLKDLLIAPPANIKYVNPADINNDGVILAGITIQNNDGTTTSNSVILVPVPQ